MIPFPFQSLRLARRCTQRGIVCLGFSHITPDDDNHREGDAALHRSSGGTRVIDHERSHRTDKPTRLKRHKSARRERKRNSRAHVFFLRQTTPAVPTDEEEHAARRVHALTAPPCIPSQSPSRSLLVCSHPVLRRVRTRFDTPIKKRKTRRGSSRVAAHRSTNPPRLRTRASQRVRGQEKRFPLSLE